LGSYDFFFEKEMCGCFWGGKIIREIEKEREKIYQQIVKIILFVVLVTCCDKSLGKEEEGVCGNRRIICWALVKGGARK